MTLPNHFSAVLGDIRLSMRADLDRENRFTDIWLALGNQAIAIGDQGTIIRVLPLGEITAINVDELHGRARLMATTAGGDVELVRYSAELAHEFAAVCRALNRAIKGQSPDLPDDIEPFRDAQSGLPLLERGQPPPRSRNLLATLTRITGLLAPYRWRVAGLIALTFASVGLQLIPPLCFKAITDRVIGHGQQVELLWWILLMGASYLLVSAIRLGATTLNIWLSLHLVGDLRSALHTRLQLLRMSYHGRHESGELIGRVASDTGSLQHFLADGLPWLLVNAVSVVAIAGILFWLDPRLAVYVLIPVPVIILGGAWFHRGLIAWWHRVGNRNARMHSLLGESIRGVKSVKAAGQESRRAADFDQLNADLVRSGFQAERGWLAFNETTALSMAIGVLCVWWAGAGRVTSGELTLGTLVAFAGYLGMFYGPLQWFTAILNWMGRAVVSAERIFQVIDQPGEEDPAKPGASFSARSVELRLEGVHFGYERGKEVLHGIDITVPAGTMIGLVGRSGSGKSTIINLVCRFYRPDAGRILANGQDLAGLRLADWRRQVGIVMQEPFLFNASVIENIRYARPEADFAQVVAAAKAAHAHEFILKKDDGYDSLVGEGGISLSGGEKQRIAIARAILADPPVLILDEATSAIDSETERAIQEAIEHLVKGRTTIAIAHRLATLRKADRLVVIDDGKVVEDGTHAELLAKPDGVFAKLVQMQQEINQLQSAQHAYLGA